MYRMMNKLVLVFALLALSLSACVPTAPAGQAVDLPLPASAPPAAVDGIPQVTKVAILQPEATLAAPNETAPAGETAVANFDQAKLDGGYILFDREKGAFRTFARDGSLLYTSPAPGIEYPSPWSLSIVHNAVYYQTDESKNIYRTTAEGAKETAFPSQKLTDFSVSPDERLFAWSTMDPTNGNTEFWVANLDGSDAKKVDSVSSTGPVETLYFFLIGWTADGKLLYDRMPTGLGGYIPYMGTTGLLRYDPGSGKIEKIYSPPESEGYGRLCVETLREDLGKLALNCDGDNPVMTILDLASQSKEHLPALEGQGVSGSAVFSPSGKWLAYAIAEGNWQNENGKVIVVPSDLSQEPAAVTAVAGQSYPYVVGWLDEETILFTRNHESGTTLWKIGVDGKGLTQVAAGDWVGWIP